MTNAVFASNEDLGALRSRNQFPVASIVETSGNISVVCGTISTTRPFKSYCVYQLSRLARASDVWRNKLVTQV